MAFVSARIVFAVFEHLAFGVQLVHLVSVARLFWVDQIEIFWVDQIQTLLLLSPQIFWTDQIEIIVVSFAQIFWVDQRIRPCSGPSYRTGSSDSPPGVRYTLWPGR